MVKCALNAVKEGRECVVLGISGLEKKIHKRLIELGLVSQARVFVLQNNVRLSSMVISLRGASFAIDYSLAGQIEVCMEGR